MSTKEEITHLKEQVITISKKYKKAKMELQHLQAENQTMKAEIDKMQDMTGKIEKKVKNTLRKKDAELKEKLRKFTKEAENAVARKNEEIQRLKKMGSESRDFIIQSDGALDIPANTKILGGLKSAMNITLQDGCLVGGDIVCDGNFTMGSDATVQGKITSKGTVKIGDKCSVNQSITARSDVAIGENCNVEEIVSGGTVDIGAHSTSSMISSDDAVKIADYVEINQGVEYVGAVSLGKNVKIHGSISSVEKKEVLQEEEEEEVEEEEEYLEEEEKDEEEDFIVVGEEEAQIEDEEDSEDVPDSDEESKEDEIEVDAGGGDDEDKVICLICNTPNSPDLEKCLTCNALLPKPKSEDKTKSKKRKKRSGKSK